MKKIALLLSGLPRQWQPSLETQRTMFGNYQLDVFFHFWDTIETAEKDALLALTRPKAHAFEAPQDFSAFDRNPEIQRDKINIPSRVASQFYSWSRVARLFEPFMADYDFAVRSRADLQFVYSIEHIFAQLKPNDLMMPWCVANYMVSDIFALGDARAIFYYHMLHDRLEEYAKTCIFNPEALLTHHLEQRKDLHIYAERFKFFFVRRPHMANYTVEQCLQEEPGENKWLDPEVIGHHKQFFRGLSGDAGEDHVEKFRQQQLGAMAARRAGRKS